MAFDLGDVSSTPTDLANSLFEGLVAKPVYRGLCCHVLTPACTRLHEHHLCGAPGHRRREVTEALLGACCPGCTDVVSGW